MPECPYDLRDYLFDELTPAERSEVERYLETSTEAREELQQLKLIHAALLRVPDEETPRRIAFVSDKVFEPSPAMRYWREFWVAAPRAAFGLAAVVLAVFGGLWMVQPTVTADGAGWRVAFGAANAPAVTTPAPTPAAMSAEQVRQIVSEALAEYEQQPTVLAAQKEPAPAASKADLEGIRQEVLGLGDDYYLLRNKVDMLSRSLGQQSDLAYAGR